jgi:hypothetical protein
MGSTGIVDATQHDGSSKNNNNYNNNNNNKKFIMLSAVLVQCSVR